MNPKTFGGSIWLLLFGAASVLLIGAFTRFDRGGQPDGAAATAPAPPPAAAGVDSAGPDPSPAVASAGVPLLPSDLSPGLAEIIKLAQAHIADDTILAYIQNSGQTYNPSADEILYLSDLGASAQTTSAESKAASRYYGGSSAYARSVMSRASCIQTFIDSGTMSADCQDLIF